MSSLFARTNFHAELLSHFRLQYLAVGVLLLLSARWLVNRTIFWVVMVLTLPHAWQVLPYYFPPNWLVAGKTTAPRSETPSDATHLASQDLPLRILSFNIYFRNQQFQQVVDYLRESQADMIVIIECSPQWEEKLRQELQDQYPYDSREVMPDWHGNHVFSKLPLQAAVDQQAFATKPGAHQLMAVRSRWKGQPFVLAAVHPSSPDDPKSLSFRNHEMGRIANFAQTHPEPMIFAGDFNCTSGSPYFRDLINESGLIDTRRGFGWQGSWPSTAMVAQIPIDHVLVSRHWQTRYREIGPDLGSDHLPVYVELDWSTTENP